jgi:hypothetical protein
MVWELQMSLCRAADEISKTTSYSPWIVRRCPFRLRGSGGEEFDGNTLYGFVAAGWPVALRFGLEHSGAHRFGGDGARGCAIDHPLGFPLLKPRGYGLVMQNNHLIFSSIWKSFLLMWKTYNHQCEGWQKHTTSKQTSIEFCLGEKNYKFISSKYLSSYNSSYIFWTKKETTIWIWLWKRPVLERLGWV